MNKQFDRRSFLKSVGFAAVVVSISSAARAQTQGSNGDPRVLELKLSDPRALEALHLDYRLPPSTPIVEMGLSKEGLAALTSAAKELTKADLQALADGNVTKKAEMLTVADINSIKMAFSSNYTSPGILGDVSCCCCTPCCCAAAVEAPAA